MLQSFLRKWLLRCFEFSGNSPLQNNVAWLIGPANTFLRRPDEVNSTTKSSSLTFFCSLSASLDTKLHTKRNWMQQNAVLLQKLTCFSLFLLCWALICFRGPAYRSVGGNKGAALIMPDYLSIGDPQSSAKSLRTTCGRNRSGSNCFQFACELLIGIVTVKVFSILPCGSQMWFHRRPVYSERLCGQEIKKKTTFFLGMFAATENVFEKINTKIWFCKYWRNHNG